MQEMTKSKAVERARSLGWTGLIAAAALWAMTAGAYAQSAVTPLQQQGLSSAQQQLHQQDLQFQQPLAIQQQQQQSEMNLQQEQQRLMEPQPQPFQIQTQLKP
jgi:hypothetical protein